MSANDEFENRVAPEVTTDVLSNLFAYAVDNLVESARRKELMPSDYPTIFKLLKDNGIGLKDDANDWIARMEREIGGSKVEMEKPSVDKPSLGISPEEMAEILNRGLG